MKNHLIPWAKQMFFPCLLSIIVLMLSCNTEPNIERLREREINLKSSSDEIGKAFYQHIKNHAMEDILSSMSSSTLKTTAAKYNVLKAKFDSLKASKNISFENVLTEAERRKQISSTVKDILLKFDRGLIATIQQVRNKEKSTAWCNEQDDKIFTRTDLNNSEKRLILDHQAILKYYIQYTFETNRELSEDPAVAKTQGAQTILCYVNCAVQNIGAFSSVGELADEGAGTNIGAAAGLIYTVVNSESCGCGSSGATCRGATSVSTPDVCYSSSNGLVYTAWGYGVTPDQFVWNFHRDDLSNSPIVRDTYSDSYTLTNSEINSASKIAVRIASLCPPGNYFYSQYLWTSPLDNGKPRPIITVSEMGDGTVQYALSGTNINSHSWDYVPSYRGTVVHTGSNFIVVDWEPDLRSGVAVTATSSCGTYYTSAY